MLAERTHAPVVLVAILPLLFAHREHHRATELACPSPVGDAEGLLTPGATVVVGEVHGTQQIPAAFAAMACHAAERMPIAIGLEMTRLDQQMLDAYLASSGGPAARDALLASRTWDTHDGRSSVAMLALVEQLRTWRARGAAVDVVAFDVGAMEDDADINEREAGMVGPLVALRHRQPDAALLVLTGGLHARLAPTARWPHVTWMAERLARELPAVTTLESVYGRGTAWICVDDHECGEREIGEGEDPGPVRVTYDAEYERGALVHHGHLHVGTIAASPPAKR